MGNDRDCSRLTAYSETEDRGEIRSGNMGFDAMKLVVLKAKCNDGLQRLGHEALVPRGFGEHIAQRSNRIGYAQRQHSRPHFSVGFDVRRDLHPRA